MASKARVPSKALEDPLTGDINMQITCKFSIIKSYCHYVMFYIIVKFYMMRFISTLPPLLTLWGSASKRSSEQNGRCMTFSDLLQSITFAVLFWLQASLSS